MAAPLPRFATCPSSSSLSPHRLSFPYHRRLQCRPVLRFLSRACSPARRPAAAAACVASSPRKSRSGRKTKSNAELCSDVKEFLASAGLPEGHVPSVKELLQHGRDDLAYIIRRRGYKLIRELLANSEDMKVYVSDVEINIAEEKEAIIANEEESEGQNEHAGYLDEENSRSIGISVEEDYFDEVDINSSVDDAGNSNMDIETPFSLSMKDDTTQDAVESMIEDTPSSMELQMQKKSLLVYGEPENSSNNNIFMPVETSTNLVTVAKDSTTSLSHFEWVSSTSVETSLTNSSDHGYTCVEPCAKPSVEEKVAKFMQDGYLEPVEDQLPEVPGEIDDGENQSSTECDMSKPAAEPQLENHNGEQSIHVHEESNGAVTPSMSMARQFSPAKVHSSFSESSAEELFDADVGNNLDEEKRKQENQAEISHLKFMLHQKELELSWLKEQIEKEKLALGMLQTKAENEISKAQKVISEKEAELQAAEESLSGLKEVKIEYSGNGDIVEVAGGFNGWHHPIKMDPHPLATATDTVGSRRSTYWSTMLWLYPGTYEIKFIVDGKWTVDPQKESVTRGAICNNVLQVDR
ncbi:LOW QUALITY PROTEIN: protein PTST homolog 3, chloroplastic [Eucalyptus grandis]|uniref:LOW QUALITY PROTEIN: protein PTST homolog 3, chloroplastic n=1 Tax=Eucalyptus grandis TaxID=71139 RepID=UPI00192EF18E|nr:LOW QUALITY PROTEIN: protein PTST homolog 3, chloroplastic [Eucalyptus grandis]